MNRKRPLLLLILLLIVCSVKAENYYVARDGDDMNPGTEAQPFLTIGKALIALNAGDTCFIKQGTYRETLNLSRSGSPGAPIVIAAYQNDSVLITATDTLDGWTNHQGNIYRAPVQMGLGRQNMLYFDGNSMDIARWPNNTDHDRFTIDASPCLGGSASTILGSGIPDRNWTGGYVWYLGAHSGASWTRPVTGFDFSSNTVSFPAIDINKWPFHPHNPTVLRNGNRGRFFLFGVLDALDHPGEWYFDGSKDSVYFQAPENADPSSALIEVAAREFTINLDGSFIHIDGIDAFGGRVRIAGNNCVIRNGTLSHCLEILDELDNTDAQMGIGSIAIESSNNLIENNIIEYGSSNGIALLYAWKGSSANTVRNNVIRHFNTIGIHSCGIRSSCSQTVIAGNTIYSCGRDGIYVSGPNSEIAYNDVSGCMKINNDGGVFYTVGNQSSKNTKIHHNWFHDSYGPAYADGRAAGIYLDNDSKGYHVHHNVVWNVTWTGLQMNWDNWYNDIFNNSFWQVGGAMGNWLNGRELIDNKIYNNYSNVGPWVGNEFIANIIDPSSPFNDVAGRDFTPRQGSVLVDSGIYIPGTTDPYLGLSPDVGAYEFGISAWRPGVNPVMGGDTLISLKLSFVEPSGGESLTAPADVNVEISATSEEGVLNTVLYLDGTLVSYDSVAPYRWEAAEHPALSSLMGGRYTLLAEATDINGITFGKKLSFRVINTTPGALISLGHLAFDDGLHDAWVSNMIINEGQTYTNITDSVMMLRVDEFNFYAHQKADPVTPFVVRVKGDNDFITLAIGSSRTSADYEIGKNSFAFRDYRDTIVYLEPGETIAGGFLDAFADGSGGGAGSVIPFNETEPADEIWYTGGTQSSYSGSLKPGYAPVFKVSPRTYYRRNYHYNIGFTIVDSSGIGVSVMENHKSSGMRVYPNPVTDSPFQLKIHAIRANARISIYDMHGRIVYRGLLEGGRGSFDPGVLPYPGLFVIVAEAGDRHWKAPVVRK